MHELSLVSELLKQIDAQAIAAHVQSVCSVSVAVGQLSCVEPSALRFCFDAVKQGTAASDADLTIDEIAGRARCNDCGQEFDLPVYGTSCPSCGSFSNIVLRGEELQLVSLEVT